MVFNVGMASVQRVLIVGGGVAGMSCAIQLRRAGLHVDLVEIDPHWRIYGAGITITGPTLRALRTLEVLDEVVAVGATWRGAKVHDQLGNLIEEVTFPALDDGLPTTGGVMRPLLHKVLSAKTLASGTNVRLGTTLVALEEQPTHVEVALSDGARAAYDLVVGADGIFSKLRERVFPQAARPVFTGQVVYRLVAERPAGFDRSWFYMAADAKVGFSPVSSTQMYMFLLHSARGNAWIEPAEQPRRLYEAMEGYGGIVPEIRQTVLSANAHTVNYRPLEVLLHPAPWHRGHVVLIGDAVHATTPHLASGAGMAIEDGIVLAEELQSQPLEQALASFMSRRFERCRLVVENSVRLGQIEMSGGSQAEHMRLMTETLGALRRPI
jgi:2-polyprenyl-6-methoxyphenol hydroxylase-like FAD-dependent oxidoreductase